LPQADPKGGLIEVITFRFRSGGKLLWYARGARECVYGAQAGAVAERNLARDLAQLGDTRQLLRLSGYYPEVAC